LASSAPQQRSVLEPAVDPRARSIAALSLLIAVAVIYAMLGAVGFLPLPSSLESVMRGAGNPGHMRAVVSGYYWGGSFPPGMSAARHGYLLSSRPKYHPSPVAVFVAPRQADIRDGRVVVVIDTSRGLGTPDSPYPVRTLAGYGQFVAAIVVGTLIALGLAFWVAGTVVGLARRRA